MRTTMRSKDENINFLHILFLNDEQWKKKTKKRGFFSNIKPLKLLKL